MSSIFDYFSYYFYETQNENNENNEKIQNSNISTPVNTEKKFLISIDQLKSVNLQPPKNIIPAPARNMPPMFDKIDLRNLNKAQLDCILNVKLKPIPKIEKIVYYEPRHPVLSELLKRFKEQSFNI
jgi:hypothetical protein